VLQQLVGCLVQQKPPNQATYYNLFAKY
jgi:hypothetical protein